MICKHDLIQTYRTDDGEPVLWACYECRHKFEPLAVNLRSKYASAVRTLQDIAAMGRKAGSESAKHRLIQLGEPIEPEAQ